jgi:hypothetical protein
MGVKTKMISFKEFLAERNEIVSLKANKIALEPEEREKAMKAKAVWHPGNHDKPTCAIWKSKRANGKIVYGCNTHRVYQTAATLDGAIKLFHTVVKDTA